MSANNIVVDIKDKILAEDDSVFSFASDSDWCINLGDEPEKPDNCVTLYSVPSRPPGLYNNPALALTEYPGFQVRVRGTGWVDVYNKIKLIESYISHIGSFTTGTMKYLDIIPLSSENQLPKDENNRYIFVQDFYAIREDTA